MERNVTVIGKRIVDGVSPETGRNRNGCVIHTTYSDDNVDGTAVRSFWVNSRLIDPTEVIVGARYYLVEGGNYVAAFRALGEVHDVS